METAARQGLEFDSKCSFFSIYGFDLLAAAEAVTPGRVTFF